MNLAIIFCHIIHGSFRVNIVIRLITEIKHACISVFKVEDDLRTFAELDCGSCGNGCAHNCCGNLAFGNSAFACYKFKAVDSTDTVIFKSKQNIACLDFYFVESVCSCQRQSNSFAERNCHFAAVELQFFRNNSVNRNRTDLIAVVCSCQNNITHCACGQNTVFICTVYDIVSNIRRNFCRVTGCTYTCDTDFNRRTGGCIFGFNIIGNMVKCLGSNCCGNDDKTIGNTALGAIGGFIDYFECVFALGLAAICHGSAAVKVSCPFAAEVKHDLRLFHKCQTCGFGFLVTVCGKKNNLIILGNTNRLTGIFLCVVLICIGKHDLVVIYKHFVDSECFLNVALIGFIFIGIADFHRAVFENSKIRRFFFTRNIVAVHDKYAGGLTCCHVVVGCVDTRYYRTMIISIAGSRFLIKSRHLFGELGHTV